MGYTLKTLWDILSDIFVKKGGAYWVKQWDVLWDIIGTIFK